MIQLPNHTWAIAGGKGGVGKSLLTVSLAYWLGRLKNDVTLLDGDLGGANLHTMLGLRIPHCTIDDFILRRVPSLDHLLLETALPNVKLIAGGSDVPALANPNFGQKTRLVRAMNAIDTDFLMVDLGAGSSLNTLDLFLAAPNKLVVLTPQPTSIQNAYGFIKAAFFRLVSRGLRGTSLQDLLDPANLRDEGAPQSAEEVLQEVAITEPGALPDIEERVANLKIHIIVNMVRAPKEERVGPVVSEVCRRFLGMETTLLGCVPYDPQMEKWAAVMDRESFVNRTAEGGALRASYDIAYRIAERTKNKDSTATKWIA